MAVTLAEAAKQSTTVLQRGVIETFVQENPILDRINLMSIEGNAYAYNEELALPGIAFRAVNGAYTESTGTVNPKSESLKILGGDSDVDRFIIKTLSNINDQRAEQMALKVKSLSFSYSNAFFNGDHTVDANSFDGLKVRLTGGQVLSNATDGAAINTSAATRSAFFDKLDDLLAAVPGINGSNGAIYCSAAILGKIRSAMRNAGLDTALLQDIAGKRTIMWSGVPILDAGTDASGTAVLPASETQGASAVASSIYAVKFGAGAGDSGVVGLTNGGVQVEDLGQLTEKPVFRTRIEFYTGLAIFNGKSAARLPGILNG